MPSPVRAPGLADPWAPPQRLHSSQHQREGGGGRRRQVLTMMPVSRQTPFPQYVWGTMSP